ncbi:thiol-disulfide oxidoreductase DCC family protein [Streptomyces sp. NPDC002889]|uniref:thiol-disulfide oxidoreductase DCC family protein n=1 Tax=Streptomyces sp. NPDC002889 TaxID=3364669 RepID=UPI0036A3CFD7
MSTMSTRAHTAPHAPAGHPARPAAGNPNRTTVRTPVHSLTVLYDANCSLCVHLRNWLRRQKQLVPLEMVPAGSAEARRRYPRLDHERTLREITVIGDRGQLYTGPAAWIVCLWALSDHRPKAHWLATPAGAPFVRVTMLAAAKYREVTTGGAARGTPCDDRCCVPG